MSVVGGYRDYRRPREPYRRCFRGHTTDLARFRPDTAFLPAEIARVFHWPFALSSTPRSTSSSSLSSATTPEARDLCVAPQLCRHVRDFFVRIVCVQHNTGVKAMMETVRIRQATLADLSLLLNYRRAMAEEMDRADERAVNRMIRALEPYLRAAIPEDRWHSWIAEPGGCGSVEIVQWVPGRLDPTPRRAWIHSVYIEPQFRRRGIGRQLTQTIIRWCRKRGFDWIYLHASDQGRPLYESLGFVPSSEMRLKL